LHDRVETPRPDVLERPVDALGVARDLADSVGGEGELHRLGAQQRLVLLDEGILRLGQDAYEILFGQRVELDADREAALELRDQVRGLGDVERAGGDEENMVGLDETVLGVDLRAFDDRQQVSLDAFAGDIGPAPAALAARDLVDLVQENHPPPLPALYPLPADLP